MIIMFIFSNISARYDYGTAHDDRRMQEDVRVRTDKGNFGPSPIGLIVSVKVSHYIQCTNIAFIQTNSIFFIFFETVFKVTSKLANLPWQTLKVCYKRRTLPKHSVLF